MQPGTIGVFLNDARQNPRLFRFIELETRRIGNLGFFEPVDDVGTRMVLPIREFWPLLDSLP